MKKLKLLVSKVLLAGAYSFAVVNSALADDTEIFFAPVSATSTKPNIMFAIDTSGSMAWVPGQQWVYPGTGEQSRMDIVKEVFDDVIVQLQNTNAGLMRFNGSAYGGPVLFPVLDLDLPANPIVTREVQEGEDDGVEDAAGTVDLTRDTLDINRSNAIYTAIRFQNLGIPQGATITTAKVAFHAKNSDSDTTSTTIYAENVDDAPALTAANSSISTRAANRTVQAALWEPEDWTAGNSYITSELASVVQEVVNRPNWCGGNDLVLFIEGDGTLDDRQAYSADGEAAAGGGESDGVVAPRIRIEFDNTLPVGANGCLSGETVIAINDGEDDAEDRGGDSSSDLDIYYDVESARVNGETAFKFRGLNVPQGATITEAYITLRARSSRDDPASAVIKVVDSSNPSSANTVANASSGFHSDTVAWSIPDWSHNTSYNTPSLITLVQNIVNRGDWDPGDNIAFRIDATSGDRRAYSYDGNSSRAAKLTVKYVDTYVPGSITMREQLRDAVQELPADGATPIAGLIAEAAQYFAGEKVTYGISRWSNWKNRISHELSYQGGTPYTPSGCTEDNPNSSDCSGEFIQGTPVYTSPITDACQTSHLVYLTDGEANRHDTPTRTIYSNLTGGASCSSSDSGEDCAEKLAGFMNTNDLSPLTGDQTVTTHMIGFSVGADPELMRDMGSAGGGGHYAAADKDALVAALSQIIASISNVNTTFVTAGVTVNQYNRLTHNDQLYYSLFSPQSGSVWPGNVKRYRL
ncbi:MAG: VWA domain-containing protein, partial [Kangiellaceae bacterium]|nr:VWA domain-containing protein [Kangiellaceae bacterium]